MTSDIILAILTPLLSAAAAYGAIRADIRHLHEKAGKAQETAERAHERIDGLMQDTGSHHQYRRGKD